MPLPVSDRNDNPESNRRVWAASMPPSTSRYQIRYRTGEGHLPRSRAAGEACRYVRAKGLRFGEDEESAFFRARDELLEASLRALDQ